MSPKPIKKIIRQASVEKTPMSFLQEASVNQERFIKDNPQLELLGNQIMEACTEPGHYERDIRFAEDVLVDLRESVAKLESELSSIKGERAKYIPHWIESKKREILKVEQRLIYLKGLNDKLADAKQQDVVPEDEYRMSTELEKNETVHE